MSCALVRETISALLDGEVGPLSGQEVEAHLDACPECRRWRDGAHAVTRRARLDSTRTTPPPAPESTLKAALAIAGSHTPWSIRPMLTRWALVAVALLQVAVTLPALLFGSDHGAPIHVAHETGSFDMALAIGFLAAAWRPSRARGMRVLVGAAALLLLVTAALDLIGGHTSVSDEIPHLLTLAGWLLLGRLAALDPSSGGGWDVWLHGRLRARAELDPISVPVSAAENRGTEGRDAPAATADEPADKTKAA